MSDNDNGGEFGSFLAGFVIGGLVGAAVALVMAPQSGAETRSQISGKGHDLVDAGEERYHSAVESAEAYAHDVGDRASRFSQDVEEKARIVLDEGLQAVSDNADELAANLDAESGDEAETESG